MFSRTRPLMVKMNSPPAAECVCVRVWTYDINWIYCSLDDSHWADMRGRAITLTLTAVQIAKHTHADAVQLMECTSCYICPPIVLCGVIDERWGGEGWSSCSAVSHVSAIGGGEPVCTILHVTCSHQPVGSVLDQNLCWCSRSDKMIESKTHWGSSLLTNDSWTTSTPPTPVSSPALKKVKCAVDFTSFILNPLWFN